MISPMKRVKITHVTVAPSACDAWSGAFIKNPSRDDIIDAIRYDHSQLDPDIEREYDRRDNLVLCLQLLDQVSIIIYGPIKIAGSHVGLISTNESEAFVRVTENTVDFDPIAAIARVESCPCGEIQGEVTCEQVAEESVTGVRDVEMEQRCVEAHEAGKSRPLQEFIDALKAEPKEPCDQFFNVLKGTIWGPKI